MQSGCPARLDRVLEEVLVADRVVARVEEERARLDVLEELAAVRVGVVLVHAAVPAAGGVGKGGERGLKAHFLGQDRQARVGWEMGDGK